MKNMISLKLNAEQLIKNANDNIESNIEILCPDNIGLCAQNILGQLRNLIDAFALFIWQKDQEIPKEISGYEMISKANKYIKSKKKKYGILVRLHHYLEIVASHYTQDQFSSSVLIYKYQDLLFDLKEFAKDLNFNIFKNIDCFPFKEDNRLQEYYRNIYDRIVSLPTIHNNNNPSTFYIEKKRRRFVDGKCLYEYILSPAYDKRTKFDRLTVFSLKNINQTHSIKCSIISNKISINGINTRAFFIDDCSVSIRPCEIKLYAFLEGFNGLGKVSRDSAGYAPLMSYLTSNNCSLFDLLTLPKREFESALKEMRGTGRNNSIFEFLKFTNELLPKKEPGYVTLTYLLYVFRHDIMNKQKYNSFYDINPCIGNTKLRDGCKHFEKLPFSYSLIGHNPPIDALLNCLSDHCTNDQLLKRHIKSNTEIKKKLFTPLSELDNYYPSQQCIDAFNARIENELPDGETIKITNDNNYAYLKGYANDTTFILNTLINKKDYSEIRYDNLAREYFEENPNISEVDETKKELLLKAFDEGPVLIISGAAGTGKTTAIKHFSNILKNTKILFLAQTNSAIENLKRRVGLSDIRSPYDFKTVENFLRTDPSLLAFYHIAVIDECSTISNKDFRDVLRKKVFDRIVLVGDEEQIESIRFGNWFGLLKRYMTTTYELKDTHRTSDDNLLSLWKLVRSYDDDLVEKMSNAGFIKDVNNDIFNSTYEDEVILCLAYDGLYGINNINKYKQEINPGKSVSWSVWSFKEGDRILFNESYYFRDYFYNNQKGILEEIDEREDEIVFKVKVPREQSNNHTSTDYVKYIQEESDDFFDKYLVTIDKSSEDDEENTSRRTIVPFQLGYALSIHKSQGLEYDSVKVVLTEEVEESVSHNIFYTAITRSKKKLSIYCEKESLKRIVDKFEKVDYDKELQLLKNIQMQL